MIPGSDDARVLALLDAALALQEVGETEQALNILQRAVAQQPRNSTIHLLIGIAYRERGEVVKAEASLRQAIQVDPNNVKAHEALGLLLLGHRRADEAIDELSAGLQKGAPDPEILRALSKAFQLEGRSEEAESLLRTQWLATSDPEIGVVYGRFLIRTKQMDAAATVFRKLIESTPSLPRPHAELAYVYLLQKEYDVALEQFQQLVKQFPQYDRGWRGLAEIYVKIHEPELALDAADHALAIDATHFRNWLAKAEALGALGRYDESLDSAQAGLDCGESDDVDAGAVLFRLQMLRVIALLNTGQTDPAIEALHSIRRAYPEARGLEHFLIRILMFLNRPQEALSELDDAVSSGTLQDDTAIPLRYEALHRLGRADEAWAFVAPQLEHENRQRIEILTAMATQLYLQGQVQIAKVMMEQLVAYTPAVETLTANLGYLLIGEGELIRARQLLTNVISTSVDERQKTITLGNLGYLELIEGNFTAAKSILASVTSSPDDALEATQRIAYWLNRGVSNGYSRHPLRMLPVAAAAKANLITTLLAVDDIDTAGIMSQELIDELPESSLPYEISGTVYLARSDRSNTRSAWETAHKLSNDSKLSKEIHRWLDELVP